MKIFKHPLAQKRWKRFKSRKLAMVSCILVFICTFFSFTAEFWANSVPVYLNYQGKSYWPVFKEYSVEDFGIDDLLEIDYRELELSQDDTVIWPVFRWDPYESNMDVEEYPGPPSSVNIMGTDDRGRDVFVRLLYGYRYSFIYAISVWLICFFLGTIFGAIMGYFGGRVDFFAQRVVEVLSTVPQFFLLLIVISIFKPSLLLLVIISCLFGWISISYYIRGEFLKNRNKEFVESARACGAGHMRVIFTHILPNSMAPIVTFTPFVIAANIVGLASLDYLGFGLNPPTPSWGELLNQAQKYFTIAWWLALFPSMALFSTLTMLSLIGEAVRDAFDPHLTK